MQIIFPASWVLTAVSVCSLISVGILGVLEIRGVHLKYSKFFNVSSPTTIKVPSRVGMLMFYAPSFLVSFASFWLFPNGDLRFLLLKSATTIHFFKRIFEVTLIFRINKFKVKGIKRFLLYFLVTRTEIPGSDALIK